MAVLVTLFGVVLALLALLVAGLLRSHAEILRALHGLGVDLEPGRADRAGISPVGAPVVRSRDVARGPGRSGADVTGESPDHGAVSVAVQGTRHLTLLAFLTSTCSTCLEFWDAFAAHAPEVPGDARLVVVTKGSEAESPASVRKLAPSEVPVVMSSAAWADYEVPVAPFFVLVDGVSGDVIGEGAAASWQHVTSMLMQALQDSGLVDDDGTPARKSLKFRSDAAREARADRDLLTAGIRPGDPSLYPRSADDVDAGGYR